MRNNKRKFLSLGPPTEDATTINVPRSLSNHKRKRIDKSNSFRADLTAAPPMAKPPLPSGTQPSTASSSAPSSNPVFNLYDALHDLKRNERVSLSAIFSNPLPRDTKATAAATNVKNLLRQVRNKRLSQQQAPQVVEPAFEEAIAIAPVPSQRHTSTKGSFRGPPVTKTPWSKWFRYKCGDPFTHSSLVWSHRSSNRPSVMQLCNWWSEQPFTWRLHHEILSFACWCELTPYEVRRRQEILTKIHFIAKALWPECEMVPFGSFVTGLCLPDGDMDICISNVPCYKPVDAVQILVKALKRSRFTRQVTPILKARIPIVKFVDAAFNIQVDISVNQDSSAETTNLVREKLAEWPMMRPLILILKEILKQWELGETYRGGIGSYLLFCMTLHHLQYTENLEQKNLGELLVGFLARFSYFDYYLDGIDIRGKGKLFAKSEMRNGGPVDSLLCVSSPLEPQTDCGRNSYKIEDIVERLQRRLARLNSVEGAEKRAVRERDLHNLKQLRESSLLSAVINCEEKLFEVRRVPSSHPEIPSFSVYRSRSNLEVPEALYIEVYRRLSPTLSRMMDDLYDGQQMVWLEYSRPSFESLGPLLSPSTPNWRHASSITKRESTCRSPALLPSPPTSQPPPIPSEGRRVFVSSKNYSRQNCLTPIEVSEDDDENGANIVVSPMPTPPLPERTPPTLPRIVSVPDDNDDMSNSDDEDVDKQASVRNHLQLMNETKAAAIQPWRFVG